MSLSLVGGPKGERSAARLGAALCFFLAALCLCLAMPGASLGARGAKPSRASLDPGFGKNGRVMTELTIDERLEYSPVSAVSTPNGGLVALRSKEPGLNLLLRYRADGKLDAAFGEGGVLGLHADPSSEFFAGGLAIDSLGRIVVGGTESSPGRQKAVIMRFLPNGRPDPSFGEAGVVRSFLGAPAPAEIEGGGSNLPVPETRLEDIAVDSQNRIVVSGDYFVEWTVCGRDLACERRESLTARLTEAGQLDSSFDSDGAEGFPVPGQIVDDRGRRLVLGYTEESNGRASASVWRLRRMGASTPASGPGGERRSSFRHRAESRRSRPWPTARSWSQRTSSRTSGTRSRFTPVSGSPV